MSIGIYNTNYNLLNYFLTLYKQQKREASSLSFFCFTVRYYPAADINTCPKTIPQAVVGFAGAGAVSPCSKRVRGALLAKLSWVSSFCTIMRAWERCFA